MKKLDTPATFADLLAADGADEEQISILEKRLLIPLGVFVALLVIWMACAPLSGAVVAPAVISVDLNARFVVEARIRAQDISYVHKGAAAEVRLTSVDARVTPLLKGNVTWVSGNRITTADGHESYFNVTVEVDAAFLAGNPGIHVQPGMPAELYILTGKDRRSLLAHLFAARPPRHSGIPSAAIALIPSINISIALPTSPSSSCSSVARRKKSASAGV